MKSIVIVGPNSMLGREIARQLTSEGVTVIRAGRGPECEIRVDLESSTAPRFKDEYSVDAVFHCASAFFDDTPEGIHRNFSINSAGNAHVLQIMERAHCRRIVYAGSVMSMPDFESEVPYGSYGFSKAEGERVLAWGVARRSGTFCSLRLPHLWDTEGLCCAHQPWFGRIVAYASRGLRLKMPASGGVRNFLHVSDAAQLMIRAARAGIEGIWPVTHPTSVNFVELARSACEIFSMGGTVVVDPSKKPFRAMNYPDGRHIYELLDYVPQLTMTEGIARIRDAGTAPLFGPMDVT